MTDNNDNGAPVVPPTPPPSLSSAFQSSNLSIVTTTTTNTNTNKNNQNQNSSSLSIIKINNNNNKNNYKTTAYYNDLSGRTRVNLQFQLECTSKETMNVLIHSGCVSPAPSFCLDKKKEEEEEEEEEKKMEDGRRMEATLRFECQPIRPSSSSTTTTTEGNSSSSSSSSSSLIAIEGVSILSTSTTLVEKKDDDDDDEVNDKYAILFDTEIIVRAAPPCRKQRDYHHHHHYNSFSTLNNTKNQWNSYNRTKTTTTTTGASSRSVASAPYHYAIQEGFNEDDDDDDDDSRSGVQEKTTTTSPTTNVNTTAVQLEIRAVLVEQKHRCTLAQVGGGGEEEEEDGLLLKKEGVCVDDGVALGLLALELGGSCLAPPPPLPGSFTSTSTFTEEEYDNNKKSARMHYDTDLLYTPPCTLSLHLVDALEVSVQEVGSARSASGATLVALTVAHSNVHLDPVTVTNIALHPGHSRLLTPLPMPPSSMPSGAGSSSSSRYGYSYEERTTTTTTATSSLSVDTASQYRGNLRGVVVPPSNTLSNSNRSLSGGTTTTTNNNNIIPTPNNISQRQLSTSSSSATTTTTPVGPATVQGWSMQGGELSVIDMSRRVKWGYANGTAPSLPLVLKPYEAFATVIQIDAAEDMRSRPFVSPVAVTAVVGEIMNNNKQDDDDDDDGEEEEGKKNTTDKNNKKDGFSKNQPLVVVATDARWTTARLAVEPSDAFKVDMSLQESRCVVGAPLVVSLKVLNLSNETRDLMLLMAKDEERSNSGGGGGGGGAGRGSDASVVPGSSGASVVSIRSSKGYRGSSTTSTANQQQQQQQQPHGVNTAVVSEVNGYTFGVWGLSGDDDGTTRHNRDHELLAVDAALLLGEVKGQHTIEAELRFVPLREGTLNVPNLKLYDKMGGKWYNCVHLLKIVVAAKA